MGTGHCALSGGTHPFLPVLGQLCDNQTRSSALYALFLQGTLTNNLQWKLTYLFNLSFSFLPFRASFTVRTRQPMIGDRVTYSSHCPGRDRFRQSGKAETPPCRPSALPLPSTSGVEAPARLPSGAPRTTLGDRRAARNASAILGSPLPSLHVSPTMTKVLTCIADLQRPIRGRLTSRQKVTFHLGCCNPRCISRTLPALPSVGASTRRYGPRLNAV